MLRDNQDQDHRDDLAKAVRSTPRHGRKDTISAMRTIVADRQAARVGGVLVDLFTASAVVAVHDALNETNRAKFAAMPVRRMALLALRLGAR